MNNSITNRRLLARIVLGILAPFLCVAPARAQYISTVLTNLNQPAGVAIDSNNNVYITDPGNYRIARYVPSSGSLITLAGSGSPGTNTGTGEAASFFLPQGIVAARGGLIVADEGSQLIRYVTFQGTVSNLAGQAFLTGDANGPAATATFSYPAGIAADGAGDLFVADTQNGLIREIDANNIVSTLPTGGYTFDLPNAVAVDNNSNVWVTDSGHEVICMISNGLVTVVAGRFGQAGTNDSLTATSARFNSPSGLLWVANDDYFLISDTGNDTIRSLFLTNFNGSTAYAVQTVAGLAGQPGPVNGALSVGEFNSPIGLCPDPTDFGFYVADSENNSLRVLQATAPLPQIIAPKIGYVSFPIVGGVPSATFNDFTGSSVVFNNINIIAIMADPTAQTFMTYGPTGSVIPAPGPATGSSPQIYTSADNGLGPSQVPPTVVPPLPDMTVYAISQAAGRPTSPQVYARIQYVTANPTVTGDNAASILLTDTTLGATMYYTIDGSSPTNDGSSGVGVGSGTYLSLNITNNVPLLVRAFASGLAPSQIISNELLFSNVVGNLATWGFSSGPASTHFVTALNLLFIAPVAFTELPSSLEIYAMQLDLTVTNNGASPPPPPLSFVSDLLQPIKGEPNEYAPIPPGIYINGVTNFGVITTQPDTLEVAWQVTPPVSNLYSSAELLEFSGAAETFFDLDSEQVAVLGELSFIVPAAAKPGTPYTLQINYPSASSYVAPQIAGPPINVFIQAPTNGPQTGTGLNALKLLTVLTNNSPASAHLVGDVFPFNWYNIGDFGDALLLDDDVIQTMENVGVFKFDNNPYYDAMDSSDGSVNNYYLASDSAISAISTGDGVINVDDVYVTLRRSLDPGITNYSRYWSGSSWVPTVYTNSVQSLDRRSPSSPPSPVKLALSPPRFITVAADQVQTGGKLTAQVPIRVLAADTLPVRVFMLNVVLEPLDGSPAIATAVSFSAAAGLGSPYATVSKSVNNYAAAWLDSTVAGVSGANIIGALTVTLPPTVNANSAYRVHFDHFSASPNGIALFHATVQDGLITVGDRTGSSWHDGIPDAWRLLYFGTVSNALSAADADPDGDGASNWDEYIAGTNPLDGTSVFRFLPGVAPAAGGFTLQWPSVVNKIYSVQSSASPAGGWTTVASNLIGNSQTLQWTDTNASAHARFYRALVQ
jgi:sugar lactone lactonase YvrE